MNRSRLTLLLCGAANFGYVPEFVPDSICSIDNGSGEGGGAPAAGGGGAGGGAADLLDEPAAPGAGGAPAGDGAPDPNAGGDPEPVVVPDFARDLSADKPPEGGLSDQEWIGKKGFKDWGGVIQSLRSAEKALGDSGRVKIPGADAKPEEVAAFNKAIGVPDKAEEYEIALPDLGEGDNQVELDVDFLEPMRAAALAAGIPKAAFGKLGDAVIKFQLDSMHADMKRNDAERDAKLKEWGPEAAAKTADFRVGAKITGLDRADVARLQLSLGAAKTLDLLAKIGGMAGEDIMAGGDRGAFGVASAAEAQASIDQMIKDPETAAKIRAKDPATVSRYNRLNEALAHHREVADRKK